jgi:hypothetical protein|tara:strand:- start:25 stop:285 length:261 start_codon:yes stop_codon:yes gene_type:complete
MSLRRFIREANGEVIEPLPVVEVTPLDTKLGDIEEHFENYTGAIADFIMSLKESGLKSDEEFKDSIDQLMEVHEELKNNLWKHNKE